MSLPVLYKNILLVEDDDDDFMLFRDSLTEIANDVHLSRAEDGVLLMEFLAETILLPDIIFLDLNMPRKNGFQCLIEMRHSEKLKGIPVIVISTSQETAIIDKAYQAGATHYLTKPSDFRTLRKSVHNVLATDWQERRAQRELTSLVSV